MYHEYTWSQFKNIDYIRKLPLQEQINRYNQYVNDLSNQIRLHEMYKNPNSFQSFQSSTAAAGTGGGPDNVIDSGDTLLQENNFNILYEDESRILL
jgi:hypothetical protein